MRKQPGKGKGAMPLGMFRRSYAEVNVGTLQRIGKARLGGDITPKLLLELGAIDKLKSGLRVLGNGEIDFSATVYAHHFSASAKAKIEAAGGRAEVLPIGASEPKPSSEQTAEGAS